MAPIVPIICTAVEERPTTLYGLSYDPITNEIDHGQNGAAAIRKYMETWMLENSSRYPQWVGVENQPFERVKMWILDENEDEERVVGVLWALENYRPWGDILPKVEGNILWELQAQYRELAWGPAGFDRAMWRAIKSLVSLEVWGKESSMGSSSTASSR